MNLQTHIDRFNVTKAQLAAQLELDATELSRILATRRWPQEVQNLLIKYVLTSRDIRALGSLKSPTQLIKAAKQIRENNVPSGKIDKFCESFQQSGGAETDSEAGEEGTVDNDTPLNRLKQLNVNRQEAKKKSNRTGGSAGTPVSILIMRAFVGLFFGIIEFVFYLLSSRGYQAVTDLEERAGNALEAQGPDKVTLWLVQVTVVLVGLVFFWPDIKAGVHWIRHPHFGGTQNAPGQGTSAPSPGTSAPSANSGEPKRQDNQNNGKSEGAAKGSPVKGNQSPPSAASRPTGNPAVTGVPAAPTDVHYDLKTPDLIILRWRAVGPGVTYNVYSSATSDLAHLRKENDQPVHLNVVTWTPETGLERYWIVVTALDSQNHESDYSEAIEVVRHPEASGPSTMDKASDAIKKVLPW